MKYCKDCKYCHNDTRLNPNSMILGFILIHVPLPSLENIKECYNPESPYYFSKVDDYVTCEKFKDKNDENL